VGLGDRAGVGDRVGLEAEGIGLKVWVGVGSVVPAGADGGRT